MEHQRLLVKSRMDQRHVISIAAGILLGFLSAYFLFAAMQDSQLLSRGPYSNIDSGIDPDGEINFHADDEDHHRGDDKVAREMAQKVRVLCWVMTRPQNHETKAQHVKATWGKRCNVLLFMSSANDSSLPTVALPVQDGREHLWAKVRGAFKYAYEKYKDEVDWFMKADDDTYVIVENLRYMLSSFDPQSPLYLGCRFKPYVKQGYMSGGAGYILSKEGARRFVEEAIPDSSKCLAEETEMEDIEISRCLENVGVKATDTRDAHGRGRFFPLGPEFHLFPNHKDKNFWYWNYTYYPTKNGLDSVSDITISFHYVAPNMMHVLEYLIYHLRLYGISHKFPAEKTNSTSVIEN